MGTIPPTSPGAPSKRPLVAVTGASGAGKSTLIAALRRVWGARGGRLLELAEVRLENPDLLKTCDLVLWLVSGDPFHCGFALGWTRCAREAGGAPIGLVINQAARGAAPAKLPGDAAALASLPYDAGAPKGEPGYAFQRAMSPLVAELERLFGGGSEEAAATLLSKQLGVPYASRENRVLTVEPTQGLELVVPADFARAHALLPLFIDGKTLAVAMADPTDRLALDALRLLSGMDLQPFIAARGQLRAAIDEFYSAAPARDTEIILFVNAMLKQAFAEKATLIVLVADAEGVRLRFEIDGEAHDRMPPPPGLFPGIVKRLKTLAKLDPEKPGPQDGTITGKTLNEKFELGVAILPTESGGKVVLHVHR